MCGTRTDAEDRRTTTLKGSLNFMTGALYVLYHHNLEAKNVIARRSKCCTLPEGNTSN